MVTLIKQLISYLQHKKVESYLEGLKNRGLHIGEGTSLLEPFFLDPDHCFLISIGDNCTFAPNVRLIAHDASTKNYLGYTRIGKITINENCFIGDSVIVLPNVTIGANTIIGAGSVVNKDIPDNSVAAGMPARVICDLEDYLDRIRRHRGNVGVFGEEYLIHNISEEKKREMLDALSEGERYIV